MPDRGVEGHGVGTRTAARASADPDGSAASTFLDADAVAVLDTLADPVVVYAPVYASGEDGSQPGAVPVDFECVYANRVSRFVMFGYNRDLRGVRTLANWPEAAETPVYLAIARVAVSGQLEIVPDGNRDSRLPVHPALNPDYEPLLEGGGSHFDAWVSRTGSFVSVVWRDVTERARAEAKFRAMAEHASDTVSVINADGLVEWTSPSVLEVLGYRPDEVIGTRPFDKFHPDDLAAVVAGAETAQSADRVTFRARYRRADGEYLWLDVRITTVRTRDGAVAYRVAATRNIDREMVALGELTRSQELFARLADHASDLVFEVDVDDVVLWCSPAAGHLLGVSAEDLVGTQFVARHHPDDHEAVLDSVRRAARGETTTGQHCRVRRADGMFHWVTRRSQPVVATNGTVSSIVVTLSDATAEVTAHAALVHSEERYRMLAERADSRYGDLVVRMHDGVWAIDENGVTTFANPAMARILATTVDELMGSSVLDWIHPDDLGFVREHMGEAHIGISVDEEFRFLRADGSVVWTLVAATPRDMAGSFHDAFAVVTDITALKEAEAAAVAARDAADAANRAKTEFLARMSHELRTPLHVILGFANLAGRSPDSGTVVDYAHEVDSAGRHLLRLIDDLLDVTRIEARGLNLQMGPVNLDEALQAAVRLTAPAFPDNPLRIDSPGGMTVWADRDRLVQVLVNLMGNGARHGHRGTEVHVRASVRAGGEARDEGSSGERSSDERSGDERSGDERSGDERLRDEVLVSVANVGDPIPNGDRDRIFEPFVRLSDSDGVGLGLSVCAGLVAAMGGRIGTEGTDVQTVFWFTLPVGAPQPLGEGPVSQGA